MLLPHPDGPISAVIPPVDIEGHAFTAGLLVLLAILALIAYTTTHKAWPAFTHQGLSFFTSNHWDPNVNSFGAADFEFGTILTRGDADRDRSTGQHRHRLVHHRARTATRAHGHDVRRRPVRVDPVGRVRLLGPSRARQAR